MAYDSVHIDKQCRDLTAIHGAMTKTRDFFHEHPDRWIQKAGFVVIHQNGAEVRTNTNSGGLPVVGGCMVGMIAHFMGFTETGDLEKTERTFCRATGVNYGHLVQMNDHGITSAAEAVTYLEGLIAKTTHAIANGLPDLPAERKPFFETVHTAVLKASMVETTDLQVSSFVEDNNGVFYGPYVKSTHPTKVNVFNWFDSVMVTPGLLEVEAKQKQLLVSV